MAGWKRVLLICLVFYIDMPFLSCWQRPARKLSGPNGGKMSAMYLYLGQYEGGWQKIYTDMYLNGGRKQVDFCVDRLIEDKT